MLRVVTGILVLQLLLGTYRQSATAEPTAKPAPSAEQGAERLDRFGDPLPPHVMARMGTVRLRHGDAVTSVAFTPDRKAVVSASGYGFGANTSLRIWDVATGKELRRLVGHKDCVGSFAFSPDGKRLASVSQDHSLRIWDLNSGKELHNLNTGQPTHGVAFSPDGKILATSDVMVRLWDPTTGKQLREFDTWEWIFCVAFSPDGRTIASGMSKDPKKGLICLWDVATGKEIRRFKGHSQSVRSLAFSPDGTVLVSASEDGTIRKWKTATGEELRLVMKKKNGGLCLALSPDGKIIAGAGELDGLIHLFESGTGRELRQFGGEHRRPASLAFSPDGKTLVAGGVDSTLRLWDVATGKELLPALGTQSSIWHAALAPDDATLAVSNRHGGIACYDVASGKLLRFLGRQEDVFWTLAFTPDGKALVSAGTDGTVRTWKVDSGELLRSLRVAKERFCPAAFSPDLKALASNYPFRLLDLSTGKERPHQFGDWPFAAFAHDGKVLVTASYKGDVRLWSLETGQELRRLRGEEGTGRFAFSPDGRWLAAESGDREKLELRLWNVTTGEELRSLRSPQVQVTDLRFSPDSRTLATAGSDHTIRFWETATGRQRGILRGHSGPVLSLAFLRDGRRLVSGSRDATALLWDLPSLAGPRPEKELSPEELRARWDGLASDDADKAYRAIWSLASSPTAVKFLGEHLRPSPTADARRLAQLIADLDSDTFAVRDRARSTLEELGETAEAALKKEAAAPASAETGRQVKDLLDILKTARRNPSGSRLQALRAVEALEAAATPEARQVLRRLAGGAADTALTREAKASLDRLEKRQ